jgi:hypothetical protein
MTGLIHLLQALGLSTAGGLNAYVPLLVVGLLARFTSLIELSSPYDLLAHPVVLVVLALLAVLDFVGDKVPALDHALHVVGLVVHPIAGAIVFLAASSDTGAVHPVLAAVCGLILAGGTHLARMTVRPASTATTGGVANPVLSFCEDVVSLFLSVLAIIVPILAALFVLLLTVAVGLLLRRWWRARRRQRQEACGP